MTDVTDVTEVQSKIKVFSGLSERPSNTVRSSTSKKQSKFGSRTQVLAFYSTFLKPTTQIRFRDFFFLTDETCWHVVMFHLNSTGLENNYLLPTYKPQLNFNLRTVYFLILHLTFNHVTTRNGFGNVSCTEPKSLQHSLHPTVFSEFTYSPKTRKITHCHENTL